MSAAGRVLYRKFRTNFHIFKTFRTETRTLCTAGPASKPDTPNVPSTETRKEQVQNLLTKSNEETVPLEYRFIYPEFLPDPKPEFRNKIRERLERLDMMARRSIIDIPEFYVGSILAVTYTEPHAPGKANRFVGICIQRSGCGLRASFILRNVIDSQGVDVVFEMYDPNIQKIDCLRLEKRLDEHLLYLRDAPAEYSTVPLDMEMELLPEGSPVPVNDLKVPMKRHPWQQKWERQNLKGLRDDVYVSQKKKKQARAVETPWEKYDLMKTYRETIPEEEQKEIFAEVYSELHRLEITRRKMKRKRGFIRPKKTA